MVLVSVIELGYRHNGVGNGLRGQLVVCIGLNEGKLIEQTDGLSPFTLDEL